MSKMHRNVHVIYLCRTVFFIFMNSRERLTALHFKRLQVGIIVNSLKFVIVLSVHG
jgi:hypothetical protein